MGHRNNSTKRGTYSKKCLHLNIYVYNNLTIFQGTKEKKPKPKVGRKKEIKTKRIAEINEIENFKKIEKVNK